MTARRLLVGVLALLLAVAFAEGADDARAAAAADHLRTGELKELLTKAGVEFGDCKEKEDLIQRVLESSARELLPDIELDDMVIADDDGSEADGSSDSESHEPPPELPVAEDANTESAASASEAGEAQSGTPPEPTVDEPVEVEKAKPEVEPAAADTAEPEAGEAAEPSAPAAEEGKLAQSKLAQSKVLEGEGESAPAETAPGASAAPEAEAVAAPAPAAEYTQAQLQKDLGAVQMMAQMGLANQMMEGLTRITFGLADEDRDGQISRQEAAAFATRELRDGRPLATTLGLSGGALRLDDAAAVEQVIGAAFAVCDTNADNLVNTSEARAVPCRKHMYELLVSAPQPAAAKPAAKPAAAAASTAPAAKAGAAAGGTKDPWAEMFKSLGAQGAADRGGVKKTHPLFAQLERRLRRAQTAVMRNLQKPNFNTFLAGLGVCAMLLQQVLNFDVANARHRLRGLVGGDLPDFTHRLQNVALALMLAAALARFE